MKWCSALEKIRDLAVGSEFALIISYLADRNLLENILGLNKTLGKNMVLITESTDQFWYPHEPIYEVISNHQIASLDSKRALHAKVFLFGRTQNDGKCVLNCLVGSCNATVSGFCRNIEFWAAAEATIDLSKLGATKLFDLIFDKSIDINLLDFANAIYEPDGKIVGPIIDLIWRLIRESNGQDSGLEFRKKDSLSDKYFSQDSFGRMFVHTFGSNSLVAAINESIKTIVKEADKNANLLTISPYHDSAGFFTIFNACKEALGLEDKIINIRLLTSFPPDFANKYGSNESFADLQDLKTGDSRIKFSYRYWTSNSLVDIKEITGEDAKPLSRAFLHGKAIVMDNDKGSAKALIGSPNLTKAALSTEATVNLETAIWERDSSSAKSILKDLDLLWQQGKEPTPAMNDRLFEWTKNRQDKLESATYWVEGSDAIKNYVKSTLVKTGSKSDRIIYSDELSNALLEVHFSEQIPEIKFNETKYTFIPDLDSAKRYERRLIENAGRYFLPLNEKQEPPTRVFYQLTIVSTFEKEVTVKFRAIHQNNEYLVQLNPPVYNQLRYKANLLLKTSAGWKEFKTAINEIGMLQVRLKERPISDFGKLRLYGPVCRNYPIKWDSFTVIKPRPEILVEKTCSCQNSFCLDLMEKTCINSAPITGNVELTIRNVDGKPPLKSLRATKLSSNVPFNARFFFYLPENLFSVKSKIDLNLFFDDEHGGFRPRNSLTSIINLEPAKFQNVCELAKLFQSILLTNFEVITGPSAGSIVGNAPIHISLLIPSSLCSFLQKVKANVVLEWYTSRWARPSKKQILTTEISAITKFVIQPKDLEQANIHPIDLMTFNGLLHAQFFIEVQKWLLPIKYCVFEIKNTAEFVLSVFPYNKVWQNTLKYIGNTKNLLDELANVLFQVLSASGYGLKNKEDLLYHLRTQFTEFPGRWGHKSLPYCAIRIERDLNYSFIENASALIAKTVHAGLSKDASKPAIEQTAFIEQYSAILRRSIFILACRPDDLQHVLLFPNALFNILTTGNNLRAQ